MILSARHYNRWRSIPCNWLIVKKGLLQPEKYPNYFTTYKHKKKCVPFKEAFSGITDLITYW